MNILTPTSKSRSRDGNPQADLSEEQIIASLYKDVNNNADNEEWALPNPKISLYGQRLSGSKSLTLSSSPPKQKQNLAKQKTLPPPFSPSLKIVTTTYEFDDEADPATDAKDTMESPTFYQVNLASSQSPSFRKTRQSPETFSHKQQRGKESDFFSDLDTKTSTPKIIIKEAPVETKEKTNIKLTSILEDNKNRRTPNQTPQNITSLGAFHDFDNTKSKIIIDKDERLATEFDRITSETKDYQFFVNALEEFKEENRELINQLELPTSIPDLPNTGRGGASGFKTNLSLKEGDGDQNQIADPVSLGTLGNESAILLNTEEIDLTLIESQLKFWKGSMRESLENVQQHRENPRLNGSPKQVKDIRFAKKEIAQISGKPGVSSQSSIKQEVQPKMVEITLMLDSKNKPKIDQKPEKEFSQDLSSKLSSPQLRSFHSHTSSGDGMTIIQESLSLNGSHSHKKKTITPKSSAFKGTKGFLSPNNAQATRFFSKTPQGSPKLRPLESPNAASVKSALSNSYHKIETKSLTSSPVKNTKIKVAEKPRERPRTPQKINKSSQDFSRLSAKTSPTRNQGQMKMGKGSNQQLQDYLNEETINIPALEGKPSRPKLDVIEQNLRQIKGKSLLTPTTLKHIRYPSFGGNGQQDKEGKLSTRRTTSQEPRSENNVQKSAKSKEKLDISKEIDNKEEHDNSQLSIKTKSNTSHTINIKDLEMMIDSKRKTPELPKLVISKPAESPAAKKSAVQERHEVKKHIVGGSPQQLIVDISVESNYLDSPAPLSIYSASSMSSQNPKLVDIYERNSRWVNIKESRINTMATTKKKEEMKECTFKPSTKNTTLNVESVYSQKSYNNFGAVRLMSETSHSAEKRSISKEKKSLNSYKGLHTFKKEIISPKRMSIDGPKSNFFSGKESHKGIDIYSSYS